MLDRLGELAATLEQAAIVLRQHAPARTWIDQFRAGEVLTASQAAAIAENHPQTIRGWCEAAENTSRPLGFLVGMLWLVDAHALLDEIENRRGLHARRVGESRLKEYSKTLAVSPRSLRQAESLA